MCIYIHIYAYLHTSQEAYQHKRCPLCRANTLNATTVLRYGRVLKQNAAAQTQQKYMQHTIKQIKGLEQQISGIRVVKDVQPAAEKALELMRQMDRFRTETAHMMRRGAFAFRQNDHPLAEPLPALRANVLLAALRLPVAALNAGLTPAEMYAVKVWTDMDGHARVPNTSQQGVGRGGKQARGHAGGARGGGKSPIDTIFKCTVSCVSQLIESRSYTSATRLIENGVPAIASYVLVAPHLRDHVSKCLTQLVNMFADMRATQGSDTDSSVAQASNMSCELLATGLNLIPSLVLRNMTDVTVALSSLTTTAAATHTGAVQALYSHTVLKHACKVSTLLSSEVVSSSCNARDKLQSLESCIKVCKAAANALRALWRRDRADDSVCEVVHRDIMQGLELMQRGFGNVEGGNGEHWRELEELVKVFKSMCVCMYVCVCMYMCVELTCESTQAA
jgi:hypothetical protein